MNPHNLRQMACAPADGNFGGGESGATGTLAQAKEKVTGTARDTAARIKSAASDTAHRAKAEAQRFASDTKDGTADRIGGVSSAMHESARSLEEQDPNIAWATHRIADKIQGVADYVRDRDFQALRADAENLARRHPVAFFGGLFLAGLVVGNLLKAKPEGGEDAVDDTYDPGLDTGNMSGSEAALQSPEPTGM